MNGILTIGVAATRLSTLIEILMIALFVVIATAFYMLWRNELAYRVRGEHLAIMSAAAKRAIDRNSERWHDRREFNLADYYETDAFMSQDEIFYAFFTFRRSAFIKNHETYVRLLRHDPRPPVEVKTDCDFYRYRRVDRPHVEIADNPERYYDPAQEELG